MDLLVNAYVASYSIAAPAQMARSTGFPADSISLYTTLSSCERCGNNAELIFDLLMIWCMQAVINSEPGGKERERDPTSFIYPLINIIICWFSFS